MNATWRRVSRCTGALLLNQVTRKSRGVASAFREHVAGVVVLLVLSRVIFTVAGLDPGDERILTVLDPAYVNVPVGPAASLFNEEELYVGSVAQAINSGTDIPLEAYRYMPYGSGYLVVVLAAALPIKLLGPYYVVLKILPILTTVCAGLCWILLVRAWLGANAGLMFGLLYTFAPSMFVRNTLVIMGGHPEAVAWIGATLLLGTAAARSRSSRGQAAIACGAGVAAGLGIWFTYATVPVTVAIGLVCLWYTRGRPRAAWMAAGIGALVGVIPWLTVVATAGGFATKIYGRPIWVVGDLGLVLPRARSLMVSGFYAGYDLPFGGATRSIAGLIWLGGILFGAMSLLLGRRRFLAIGLGAGVVAHVGAYLLVAPDASARYLLPCYPLLLLLAIAPSFGEGIPRVKRTFLGTARGVAVATVVLLGAFSQVTTATRSGFPCLHTTYRASNWPLFGEMVGRKLVPEFVTQLPKELQKPLWIGYGERMALSEPAALWRKAAACAGADSAWVWEGIGLVALPRYGADVSLQLQYLTEDCRNHFWYGMKRTAVGFLSYKVANSPAEIPSFLSRFSEGEQPIIREILSKVAYMLSMHGTDCSISAAALQLVDPRDLDIAKGWSIYRGVDFRGNIRYWSGELGQSVDFWKGVADAYEWDLRTRAPGWLLGEDGTLGDLANELTVVTRARTRRQAQGFYLAAGRVVGESLAEPCLRRRIELDSLDWRERIPIEFQEAFDEGLRQSGSPP